MTIVNRPRGSAESPNRASAALPLIHASLIAPSGRRTRYVLITAGCPLCGGGRHIHFVDGPVLAADRRAGCGRGRYWVKVARNYRNPGPTPGVGANAA